jgi:twitching motility protein PilT
VALVDSLLSAIVRADGDALVMHVGERPYVVVGTQTINISTHGLNLDAMTGMLAQLLPAESQQQLEEFGAVEHRIPTEDGERFSVVAARGGDDIWIEIRRRRAQPAAAAAPPAAPVGTAEPIPAPVEHPVAAVAEPVALQPVADITTEPMAAPGGTPEEEPEAVPAAIAEPVAEPMPVFVQPLPQAPSDEDAATISALEAMLDSPPVIETSGGQPLIAAQAPSAAEPPAVAEPAAVLAAPVMVDAPVEPPDSVPTAQPFVAIEPPEPVEEPAAPPLAETVAAPVAEPEPEPMVAEPPVAAPVEEVHVLQPAAQLPAEADEDADLPALVETLEPETVQQVHEVPAAPAVQEVHQVQESQRVQEAARDVHPVQAAPPVVQAPPAVPPVQRADRREPAASEPAVVVPMTRTVRIEVPPRTQAAGRGATGIDRLLRVAAARGATALFLTSNSRPWIRLEGDLRYLDSEAPLSRADVESAVFEIAPQGEQNRADGEWIIEFADIGRVRCTTFHDHRGPGVLLRMIATKAATAEQLGLSREVQALATEPQGIVLVAGPRASGKSTLLSALVDAVNRQRAEYVITLERQIRLVHDNRHALVSQREIRGSADDSVVAARAALRESPDVLVVDDLVSSHMVPVLLTAASEGLLIFVSITAPSTADAVERFIELAPPEMRKAVHNAMAESFRGAVAQTLLKKAGGGLVAAREVLLATAPVTRVIGEGQLGQLPLTLESGRKHGMASFTDALIEYVATGTVDVREAFRKAPDRERLLEGLKRSGIDTSAVERLA